MRIRAVAKTLPQCDSRRAVVICARCNQPSEERVCPTCAARPIRALDPSEIDAARAAEIAEIVAKRKERLPWQR